MILIDSKGVRELSMALWIENRTVRKRREVSRVKRASAESSCLKCPTQASASRGPRPFGYARIRSDSIPLGYISHVQRSVMMAPRVTRLGDRERGGICHATYSQRLSQCSPHHTRLIRIHNCERSFVIFHLTVQSTPLHLCC